MKQDKILILEDITKNFGGLKAVDKVSLSVEKGKIHCLIGPNGAGKTTIFKLIMGLHALDEGKIYFNDHCLNKVKTHQRILDGISIKLQIPGVFHNLRLRDNIRIALQPYVLSKEIEQEIDSLIDLVGIKNLGNPYVSNLPHGQQQWLEIAMALASKPKLLLLDEVAAGMGPEETIFTAELVRRINRTGVTIIFIDHDMAFVKEIAQDITVLHYGAVFAEGNIHEIQSNEEVVRIYLGKV